MTDTLEFFEYTISSGGFMFTGTANRDPYGKWYNFPKSTKIWHYTNIYPSAQIGENCVIGSFVEIGHNVRVGNGCRIEAHAFIPEGVTLEDNVFVGPHVCFTNDKLPPSFGKHWAPTVVKKGAVLGANATILPGVIIGENAVIGAGAIVTKDVEAGAIVFNEGHAVRKGTRK